MRPPSKDLDIFKLAHQKINPDMSKIVRIARSSAIDCRCVSSKAYFFHPAATLKNPTFKTNRQVGYGVNIFRYERSGRYVKSSKTDPLVAH